MSNYERCEKCGQWDWVTTHTCYPFQVYYPDYYGEEWETVYGKNPENVVEIIAEMLNQEQPEFDSNIFEYPIVIKDQEGNIEAFHCTASLSIDYNAEKVDLPKDYGTFSPI